MKHDLCTNLILASQLSDTDVNPEFIHRHICQDATLAHMWCSFITLYISFSIYFLICLPLHSFSSYPHLNHTFFLFLLPSPHTLLPTYLYMVFMQSSSSFPLSFLRMSPSPPLSNAVGIPYWWGMGGPVLLAYFNELLWGSDRRCQKWRSAIQPTSFNASLLTTVFLLHVSKAGEATGRTTRATSKKHM